MTVDRSLWIRACLVACAGTLAPAAFAASGEGLTASADNLAWARWQGRVSLVTAAPAWRADLAGADGSGLKLGTARLLGDYYFLQRDYGAGVAGGFRATSGVIVGSRAAPWSPGAAGSGFSVERRSAGIPVLVSADTSTVPYVGIGYSGASLRGGWAFSADLGVMSLNPGGAVKLGRVFGNIQNLDDVVRELRLSPVLQLGVSYSF